MGCYCCRNANCSCKNDLLQELNKVRASEARLGKIASYVLHVLTSKYLYPDIVNKEDPALFLMDKEDLEEIVEGFFDTKYELDELIKPLRAALADTEYLKKDVWWIEVLDPVKEGYDTVGNYMLFGNNNQARIPYPGWGKDIEKMGWVMYKRKTK